MKIKISRIDRKFSIFIRWIRDKGICQRCHKQYSPPSMALHCSHFHGRAKKSVRFSEDNTCAFCFGCHLYMGANPNEHRDFFLKRLGQRKYDILTLIANTPNRPDYKAIEMWLDLELAKAGFR